MSAIAERRRPGRTDARLARPLRQVHDLRDVLPVVERHAALPGAEVRRPAGRAVPHRRGGLAGRLGRLLLELRHLHAGLPAGRAHRRDQHPGAGEAKAEARRPAARPAPRAARRWPGASARRSRRSRTGRWPTASAGCSTRSSSASTEDAAMPQCAGRTFQRWAKRHAAAAGGAKRRSSYFHGCGANYYEPDIGEKTVAILEHNGFKVIVPKQGCCGLPLQSNGIFPARRGLRAAPGGAPRAARARGQDIVGDVDELHADGQARGAGDPRAGRGPRRSASCPTHVSTSASSCSTSTTAASCARTSSRSRRRRVPRALPAAGSQHRQAGARPVGASSRASRRSRCTRTAAASAAPTG